MGELRPRRHSNCSTSLSSTATTLVNDTNIDIDIDDNLEYDSIGGGDGGGGTTSNNPASSLEEKVGRVCLEEQKRVEADTY